LDAKGEEASSLGAMGKTGRGRRRWMRLKDQTIQGIFIVDSWGGSINTINDTG
jgi:hypothetical protein